MGIIEVLDYTGIIVFAISGVLAASEKRLDLFGGFIIAFVTALGGGTLRDLILDVKIGWISNTNYIYTVFFAVIFTLLLKKYLKKFRKTVFLFDTIGIALFTLLAVEKSLSLNAPIPVAIIMGVITATFGGVIRDILCNEIPLIFRKEIYATACVTGAIVYVVLNHFALNETLNLIISGSVIISIRVISVVRKMSLPVINDQI